jgi:outer membrane immunogenic protein
MRSFGLAMILLLAAAGTALGQALPSGGGASSGGGDAALAYHWVRTNTLGSCGCFSLNGVGLSGSWNFRPPFAAVGEVSVEHTASGPSGSSLTLTNYMAGARYTVLQPSQDRTRGLQGFAQLLVGLGHAGGGVAGPGDKSNSFVGRIGGGLDWPLTPLITARVFQADYYLTTFNNGANNHQNNMMFGAGLVFLWSK